MDSRGIHFGDGLFSSGRFRKNVPGMGVYRFAASQPGWISRVAFFVFALVITLPILILIAFAFILAGVVFGSLVVYARVTARLHSLFSGQGSILSRRRDRKGRRNVTVLPPE